MIALRFFYIKAAIPLKKSGPIKVLAKEFIETKKALYVIEFGEKLLLLGVTDDAMTKLAEETDIGKIAKIKENIDEFLVKEKMKNEIKFSEQLKANYLNQTKNIINKGNEIVKNVIARFKKDKRDEK